MSTPLPFNAELPSVSGVADSLVAGFAGKGELGEKSMNSFSSDDMTKSLQVLSEFHGEPDKPGSTLKFDIERQHLSVSRHFLSKIAPFLETIQCISTSVATLQRECRAVESHVEKQQSRMGVYVDRAAALLSEERNSNSQSELSTVPVIRNVEEAVVDLNLCSQNDIPSFLSSLSRAQTSTAALYAQIHFTPPPSSSGGQSAPIDPQAASQALDLGRKAIEVAVMRLGKWAVESPLTAEEFHPSSLGWTQRCMAMSHLLLVAGKLPTVGRLGRTVFMSPNSVNQTAIGSLQQWETCASTLLHARRHRLKDELNHVVYANASGQGAGLFDFKSGLLTNSNKNKTNNGTKPSKSTARSDSIQDAYPGVDPTLLLALMVPMNGDSPGCLPQVVVDFLTTALNDEVVALEKMMISAGSILKHSHAGEGSASASLTDSLFNPGSSSHYSTPQPCLPHLLSITTALHLPSPGTLPIPSQPAQISGVGSSEFTPALVSPASELVAGKNSKPPAHPELACARAAFVFVTSPLCSVLGNWVFKSAALVHDPLLSQTHQQLVAGALWASVASLHEHVRKIKFQEIPLEVDADLASLGLTADGIAAAVRRGVDLGGGLEGTLDVLHNACFQLFVAHWEEKLDSVFRVSHWDCRQHLSAPTGVSQVMGVVAQVASISPHALLSLSSSGSPAPSSVSSKSVQQLPARDLARLDDLICSSVAQILNKFRQEAHRVASLEVIASPSATSSPHPIEGRPAPMASSPPTSLGEPPVILNNSVLPPHGVGPSMVFEVNCFERLIACAPAAPPFDSATSRTGQIVRMLPELLSQTMSRLVAVQTEMVLEKAELCGENLGDKDAVCQKLALFDKFLHANGGLFLPLTDLLSSRTTRSEARLAVASAVEAALVKLGAPVSDAFKVLIRS